MVSQVTAAVIFYVVAAFVFVIGLILVFRNTSEPLYWLLAVAGFYLIVHEAAITPKRGERGPL